VNLILPRATSWELKKSFYRGFWGLLALNPAMPEARTPFGLFSYGRPKITSFCLRQSELNSSTHHLNKPFIKCQEQQGITLSCPVEGKGKTGTRGSNT